MKPNLSYLLYLLVGTAIVATLPAVYEAVPDSGKDVAKLIEDMKKVSDNKDDWNQILEERRKASKEESPEAGADARASDKDSDFIVEDNQP
ncbi:hypothetical protein AGMMS50289_21170 [Betaproteobacteria bacterium]|nr:hypothetical protein AGMMS50289_21170 [Betaproteobacteria bacterium]